VFLWGQIFPILQKYFEKNVLFQCRMCFPAKINTIATKLQSQNFTIYFTNTGVMCFVCSKIKINDNEGTINSSMDLSCEWTIWNPAAVSAYK
jgi:hypothetical protein